MSQCYFCTKPGAEQVHICVDAEADHDGDPGDLANWNMHGIYSTEWLCVDHLEEYDQQMGVFDPYKHRER